MKQLMYRNIYLIRKNILITAAISVALFLAGVLVALSARFGNIAKYADDATVKDCLDISTYFAILSGIIFATMVEHIPNLIISDYKKNWSAYIASTGVKPALRVGTDFALIFIMNIISFFIWLIYDFSIRHITGIKEVHIIESLSGNQGTIIVVTIISVLLLVGSYMSVMAYIFKGKDSLKKQIVTGAPIVILSLTPFILLIVFESLDISIINMLDKVSVLFENKALFVTIFVCDSIVITFICYLISLRAVRKEGRKV